MDSQIHSQNNIATSIQGNRSSDLAMSLESGATKAPPSATARLPTSSEDSSDQANIGEFSSSRAYQARTYRTDLVTSSMSPVSKTDSKDTNDTRSHAIENKSKLHYRISTITPNISFNSETMQQDENSEREQVMHPCLSNLPGVANSEKRLNEDHVTKPPRDTSSLTSRKRSPLTLSAYRRPEHTVRMTNSDPSRSITDEYDLRSPECRILGHGASSTVRLAVRRHDGAKVAVKRIAKHDALRHRRTRKGHKRHRDEWEILQDLAGRPSIVSLIDLFETEDEIQLVMEYCEGGELFDAIQRRASSPQLGGKYSEAQAAQITAQMLTALSNMHAQGIVHRDVKPENILLVHDDDSQVRVKLSDFGLARELPNRDDGDSSCSDGEASPFTPPSGSRSYSCVGTDFYAAPEVCAGEGYGTSVDLYSLGVTLYVLLCGFPPSYSTRYSSISEDSDSEGDLHSVVFPTAYWSDVSEGAKTLIKKMLHPNPSERISAQKALNDDWIVEHANRDESVEPLSSVPSLITPRPSIDLDLVRNRLYKKMNQLAESEGRKRTNPSKSRSRKRLKVDRGSTSLMAEAMKDLYRGVASMAASASAAAAGVVYDELGEDIKIVEHENVVKDDCVSQFASRTALSF